ncbi:MAG: glutamine--fructose-6-phosphate transaminase (isomerizing) [Lysobacterales bacterium]
MCGIVAASARRNIRDVLMAGLHTLEYRGYDSAGIALQQDGHLARLRAAGKVKDLQALLDASPINGHCGISHTRWATHGVPNTENAHPHTSGDQLALVHNGIIENHEELRQELQQSGCRFDSETDTEVMVHLIAQLMDSGLDLFSAVRRAVLRLRGAFAIAVVSAAEPGIVVGARKGSPLVLGVGQGENFLASDIYPLLNETDSFVFLEEGDVVSLAVDGYQIVDANDQPVDRQVKQVETRADSVQRGLYPHYMLKEIYEQPQAVAETLEGRLGATAVLPNIFGVGAEALFRKVKHVHIVACGTAYHAGLVASYQIEQLAGIPCRAEIASEYRYRKPVVPENTLFIAVSQSGETADTLAALKHAKQAGYVTTLAICNVAESSVVREADLVLMTRAGPEIGVASTKAFTTQLVALQLLVLELARLNGVDEAEYADYVGDLHRLPELLNEALSLNSAFEALAGAFIDKNDALFLGRGSHYPIAMEGALKLKEISYIHAESYAAGELKHGPLALVDAEMPVFAVAPNNVLLEKLISNIEEVSARGGELYVIADTKVVSSFQQRHGHVIGLDTGGALLSPVVMTIPLQLLAYHVAVQRGTDVDQPRNLAKSVTVE